MSDSPRPRLGLVFGSLAAAVVILAAALLLTAWAFLVLPFALIIAVCAYKGLTLTQTWTAMGEASGDDAGRGPAGMSI